MKGGFGLSLSPPLSTDSVLLLTPFAAIWKSWMAGGAQCPLRPPVSDLSQGLPKKVCGGGGTRPTPYSPVSPHPELLASRYWGLGPRHLSRCPWVCGPRPIGGGGGDTGTGSAEGHRDLADGTLWSLLFAGQHLPESLGQRLLAPRPHPRKRRGRGLLWGCLRETNETDI